MLELEQKYEPLPWLQGYRDRFGQWLAAGRMPQALLIHGREGMGRRQLALSFAELVLGADPTRSLGDAPEQEEAGHPDFRPVGLLENKETGKLKTEISVDQIRELIEFYQLTSHAGAGRAAVIYPADKLNRNSANSLLKTLEEPPAGAHIVLVVESLNRLPATILSRCQRLRVAAPSATVAGAWLKQFVPDKDFTNMLDFVDGAPLAALALHQADFAAKANEYAADLHKLEHRTASPAQVAGKWAKQPDLALQWLYWRLSRRVRNLLDPASDIASESSEGVQACFRQMDQIRELRRVIKSGISAELNLVGLLVDWYGGLGRN